MSAPLTLTTLTEDVRKLHALLEDPQPGLSSWTSMLAQRLDSIAHYAPVYQQAKAGLLRPSGGGGSVQSSSFRADYQ